MRQLMTLMVYEFRTLFLSPFAYIVGFSFELIMALIFLFLLDDYSRFLQPVHIMTLFFKSMWLPTVVFLPVITVRSIAIERDSGLSDSFSVLPIRRSWVVLSKFFVTYFYYIILLSSVLMFPFIVKWISKELVKSLQIADGVVVGGGMFFILCSSAFFVALGIFLSSIVPNQLASSVVGFILLFFVLVAGQLLQCAYVQNDLDSMRMQNLTDIPNVFLQIEDFCNGTIDIRVIMFYIEAACQRLFGAIMSGGKL
jgi:ABC-2 type transport system permease protein